MGGGGWERGVGSRFAIIRVVYLIYYHVYIGLVRSLSGGIGADVGVRLSIHCSRSLILPLLMPPSIHS